MLFCVDLGKGLSLERSPSCSGIDIYLFMHSFNYLFIYITDI